MVLLGVLLVVLLGVLAGVLAGVLLALVLLGVLAGVLAGVAAVVVVLLFAVLLAVALAAVVLTGFTSCNLRVPDVVLLLLSLHARLRLGLSCSGPIMSRTQLNVVPLAVRTPSTVTQQATQLPCMQWVFGMGKKVGCIL